MFKTKEGVNGCFNNVKNAILLRAGFPLRQCWGQIYAVTKKKKSSLRTKTGFDIYVSNVKSHQYHWRRATLPAGPPSPPPTSPSTAAPDPPKKVLSLQFPHLLLQFLPARPLLPHWRKWCQVELAPVHTRLSHRWPQWFVNTPTTDLTR